jgi:branched-chain amino acid transport system permease protein
MPRKDALAWLVLALAVLAAPALLGSGYLLNTLNFVAIYALPAIGLCLLVGYCGQLSISHAAFFAIGAYGSAILTTRAGLSPWPALLLAQAIAAALAAFIGWVVLRLRGHYLAIATLSFTVIVEVLIKELGGLTGGLQGLAGIPRLTIAGHPIASDLAQHFLLWPATLAALWFALNVAHSRMGRAWRAIKEGEAATALLGVDVSRHKIEAFVLSSLFASLGGSLYAHFVTFVSPAAGSVMFAIDIILVLAFGGFDRLWGAMLGVLALTWLNEYTVAFADYKRLAFGVALVVIMSFFPAGLLAGISALARGAWAKLR